MLQIRAVEVEFSANDATAEKRDGAGGGFVETVQLGAWPPQHLQQAGSQGIFVPLYHHRLPVRVQLPPHLPHVGDQTPLRAQTLPYTVGQDHVTGRRTHAGHGVHQHEPGQGRRVLHAHRQGLRAILHHFALRLLPWRDVFPTCVGLSHAAVSPWHL